MALVVEGALTAAVTASDAAAAVDGRLAWLAEAMDGMTPAARAVYGPQARPDAPGRVGGP
jgi:hypothetical protein